MFKNVKRTLVLIVTSGALIGLTGCATTDDLNTTRSDLQSQIDQLRSDVSSAKSDAASANSRASEAISIANEANNRSKDTAEKIDRMFKKSMQK